MTIGVPVAVDPVALLAGAAAALALALALVLALAAGAAAAAAAGGDAGRKPDGHARSRYSSIFHPGLLGG